MKRNSYEKETNSYEASYADTFKIYKLNVGRQPEREKKTIHTTLLLLLIDLDMFRKVSQAFFRQKPAHICTCAYLILPKKKLRL